MCLNLDLCAFQSCYKKFIQFVSYFFAVFCLQTSKSYSKTEVTLHNTRTDCWIIIKNKVYDVTSYVEEHPGGDAILAHAGDDSTEGFFGPQHATRVFDMIEDFYIGDLEQQPILHLDFHCKLMFRSKSMFASKELQRYLGFICTITVSRRHWLVCNVQEICDSTIPILYFLFAPHFCDPYLIFHLHQTVVQVLLFEIGG